MVLDASNGEDDGTGEEDGASEDDDAILRTPTSSFNVDVHTQTGGNDCGLLAIFAVALCSGEEIH